MSSTVRSLSAASGSRTRTLIMLLHQAKGLREVLSSDFAGKVAQTYVTQLLKIIIGIATSVIVTRSLGPEGRGLLAIAAAIGTFGVQFSNMGLHSSNTYFGARSPELLPCLTGNTLAVSLLFGGGIACLLWAIFDFFPRLVSVNGLTLALALLSIPLGLAYLLMQNLLLGLQEVRTFNFIELANRLVPAVLLLPLLFMHIVTTTSVLAISLVALIVGAVWGYLRIRQHLTSGPRLSWRVFHTNLGYGLRAYLGTFFCFLVLRADLFLVQRILGNEQAGYYSLAATLADTVNLLAVAIGTMLFPKLSAEIRMEQKLSMVWKASGATALLMAPLLALAAIVARPIIQLAFGAAFAPAAPAFVLLAPGMFFLAIHSVSVQFLNSIGYPKVVVVIWGCCAALNIVSNCWAIPLLGIGGASIVSSGCYFIATVLVIAVIRRAGCSSRVLEIG